MFSFKPNSKSKFLPISSLVASLAAFFLLIITNASVGQERLFDAQIIKFNFVPLLVNSYSISYETTLNSSWSIMLSGNIRPKNGFPFKSDIESYYSDNDLHFHDTKIAQYSVTPEIRRYFKSSTMLRGFYVGLFAQISRFKYDGMIDYIGGGAAVSSDFHFTGGITSYTGGASIGRQWRFGKALYMDWQIIGPNLGFNSGRLIGRNINGKPLDYVAQQIIANKPNEFNIPLVDVDVEASASEIEVHTNNGWAGVRVGLSLGYRF